MELKWSPLDIYLWTGAIDERDGCLWNKASVFRVSPDHPPSPPPLPGDRLQVRLLIPTTTTTTTTSLRHLFSLTLSISIRQKKRRARHRLLWGEEKIAEQHALCFLFFLFFFFHPEPSLCLPLSPKGYLSLQKKKKKEKENKLGNSTSQRQVWSLREGETEKGKRKGEKHPTQKEK